MQQPRETIRRIPLVADRPLHLLDGPRRLIFDQKIELFVELRFGLSWVH